MRFIDRAEILSCLTIEACIPKVRAAMIALSDGGTRQMPRSIIPLADGCLFGVMAGTLGVGDVFGSKLVSVAPNGTDRQVVVHQGVVVLFDGVTGTPVCVADAGEVTRLRTAAASAVATDALARKDAVRMAVLGYGEQGVAHARAISAVRKISGITIWGPSLDRSARYAEIVCRDLGIGVQPCGTVEAAVAEADVICTVTPAKEPILLGRWVRAGTHVNVVGSSYAGPAEIDSELVARSRFIADSRDNVLHQGAEFLRAKAAGLVSDDHVVGEIGQVLSNTLPGRQHPEQITIYKSLGHVVQDLAITRALLDSLLPLPNQDAPR